MRRLTTLFPSEFLEEHAEELGVVERDRKTQMPALVWSFVFGFAVAPSLFTARRMSCRVHHCPLCLGDGLSPLA